MDKKTQSKAKRLRAKGLSYSQIGKSLGVSTSAAKYWLNREYYKKQNGSPENLQRRRERWREQHNNLDFREAGNEARRKWYREYIKDPRNKKHRQEVGRELMRKRRNSFEGRVYNSLVKIRHIAKKRGHAPCRTDPETIAQTFTGKCHACGVDESTLSKRLHLDHCHTTGKFRGWICGGCNRALGIVNDNPDKLTKYLHPLHRFFGFDSVSFRVKPRYKRNQVSKFRRHD